VSTLTIEGIEIPPKFSTKRRRIIPRSQSQISIFGIPNKETPKSSSTPRRVRIVKRNENIFSIDRAYERKPDIKPKLFIKTENKILIRGTAQRKIREPSPKKIRLVTRKENSFSIESTIEETLREEEILSPNRYGKYNKYSASKERQKRKAFYFDNFNVQKGEGFSVIDILSPSREYSANKRMEVYAQKLKEEKGFSKHKKELINIEKKVNNLYIKATYEKKQIRLVVQNPNYMKLQIINKAKRQKEIIYLSPIRFEKTKTRISTGGKLSLIEVKKPKETVFKPKSTLLDRIRTTERKKEEKKEIIDKRKKEEEEISSRSPVQSIARQRSKFFRESYSQEKDDFTNKNAIIIVEENSKTYPLHPTDRKVSEEKEKKVSERPQILKTRTRNKSKRRRRDSSPIESDKEVFTFNSKKMKFTKNISFNIIDVELKKAHKRYIKSSGDLMENIIKREFDFRNIKKENIKSNEFAVINGKVDDFTKRKSYRNRVTPIIEVKEEPYQFKGIRIDRSFRNINIKGDSKDKSQSIKKFSRIEREKSEPKGFTMLKVKQNKEFSFSVEPKYRRNLIDDNKSKDKNRGELRLSRRVVNIHMIGIPKEEKVTTPKSGKFKYLKPRKNVDIELLAKEKPILKSQETQIKIEVKELPKFKSLRQSKKVNNIQLIGGRAEVKSVNIPRRGRFEKK